MRAVISSAFRSGVVFAATLGGGALLMVVLWMVFGDTIQSARKQHLHTLAQETLPPDMRHKPNFTPRREALTSARIIAVACINDNIVIIHGAATGGYGGDINFVLSIINNNRGNIRILSHKETPGIADFLDTPEGGNLSIDGVAGATITSAAMTTAHAELLKWHKQTQPCAQHNNNNNR